MYIRKYRLLKTLLDKYLKSRVSKNPSTHSMANGSKHCCNMKDNTFTMFINHCESKYVGNIRF